MTLGGGAAPLWRMGAASWGAGWRVSRRAAKRSALAGLADARRRLPRRLRSLCPRRAATQTGPRPAPAGVQDGPEGGSRVLSLRGAPRQAVQTFSPTFPREHPPCRPCGREVSKVKKTFMTVYQAVPVYMPACFHLFFPRSAPSTCFVPGAVPGAFVGSAIQRWWVVCSSEGDVERELGRGSQEWREDGSPASLSGLQCCCVYRLPGSCPKKGRSCNACSCSLSFLPVACP